MASNENQTEPVLRKRLKLPDLERLYDQGESVDKYQFSEMRSNLLLIAGEHYNKHFFTRFRRRVQQHDRLAEHQKLRLTKNHIQRIIKNYCNTLLSTNPGVGFRPKNESELQDQKSAELHKSVWRDAVDRYRIDEKIDQWVSDFTGVGEVAVKIFWDENKGPVKGYAPKLDKNGEPAREPPQFDPNTGEEIPGNMIPDMEKPIFTGEMVFERVYGFNLIRPEEAKEMEDAPWMIIRKMVHRNRLKLQFPEKADSIVESQDETFKVLDFHHKTAFRDSRNEVMLKEMYYRPCQDYPEGYFYIWTKETILAEGVLPGGIFPIQWAAYDTLQTTPRGISPVKTMRPYQVEINRSASKIAEHQITLGDDKLITQNGSKVSAGVSLPGVRHITVTGQAPTIMPGRDGSQYLASLEANIRELYEVMDLAETFEPDKGQIDPLMALFKSAQSKRRFQRNIARFNRFLINVAKTYLPLTKIHFDEDRSIKVVGRSEFVNISEFQNANDMDFDIIVEPQSEDIETKFGKQIILNNALQYVGSKLERADIGKILRSMPFSNVENTFEDLTVDYDSATNLILALDRGEPPAISPFDDPIIMAKRLVSRMRQADFRLLDPQIQQLYQQAHQAYLQLQAQQQQKLQAAQADMIPTDGPLVTIQGFFVRKPENPTSTQLVRLPHAAVRWLVDRLEDQGNNLEQLEDMNRGSLAQLADLTQGGGTSPQGVIDGQGASSIAGGTEGF